MLVGIFLKQWDSLNLINFLYWIWDGSAKSKEKYWTIWGDYINACQTGSIALDSEKIILCYHNSLSILKIKMDFSAKITNCLDNNVYRWWQRNNKNIKTD